MQISAVPLFLYKKEKQKQNTSDVLNNLKENSMI